MVTPYRGVVVGTDGSASAELAVRHAARLAVACGAHLTIVTAFSPEPAAMARARDEAPDEFRWRITDTAVAEQKAQEGAAVARQEGATDIKIRAESGDPAGVVIDVAADTGADVIVVGSKGMTSATRFVLGNVPNRVSHHAPCDVLIVHTVA